MWILQRLIIGNNRVKKLLERGVNIRPAPQSQPTKERPAGPRGDGQKCETSASTDNDSL